MIEGGMNKISLNNNYQIRNIDEFIRSKKSNQLQNAKLIAAKEQIVQGVNYELVYEINPKTPNQCYYIVQVFDPAGCYSQQHLEPGQQMPIKEITSWEKKKYYFS